MTRFLPATLLLLLLLGLAPRLARGQMAPGRVRTVAVLGFENRTALAENDWLGAGFAESLTAKLQQVPALVLVERRRIADVLRANGIDPTRTPSGGNGRMQSLLGVDQLLVGSIQLAGAATDSETRLRVDARIVAVETAEVEGGLAFSITGTIGELFALQTSLARRYCEALGVACEEEALAYRECSRVEAYRLYSLGNEALDRGEYRTAIGFYDEAMQANTGFFAEAHTNQGEAYVGLAESLARGEGRDAVQSEHLRRFEKDAEAAAPALFDLGLAYEANEKDPEAIQAFLDYLDWSGSAARTLAFKTITWNQFGRAISDGERFYAVAGQGQDAHLLALDPSTGAEAWRGLPIPSGRGTTLASGMLYTFGGSTLTGVAHTGPAWLYATDAVTGRLRWRSRVGTPGAIITQGPVAGGDELCFVEESAEGAWAGCCDQRTGAVLWRTPVAAGSRLSEADDATVLVGRAGSATLFARGDGTVSARFKGGEVPAEQFGVLVRGTRLFVHTDDTLFVYGLASGELQGRIEVGKGMAEGTKHRGEVGEDLGPTTLCGDGEAVYLAAGARISRVDPHDLRVVWTTRIDGQGVCSPVVAGQRVYAMNLTQGSRELVCLDASTGEIAWKYQPSFPLQAYAVGGRWALLSGDKGTLGALDLERPDRGNRRSDRAALVHLGNLYLRQGQPAAAMQSFVRAIEIRYDSPEAHRGLGDVFREQGSNKKALLEYLTAVRVSPARSAERAELLTALRPLLGLTHLAQLGVHNAATLVHADERRIIFKHGSYVVVYDREAHRVVRQIEGMTPAVAADATRLYRNAYGAVLCEDLESGRTLWKREGLMKDPSLADGVLLYVDGASVRAVEPETGVLRWTVGGTAYSTSPGTVVAYEASPPMGEQRKLVHSQQPRQGKWDGRGEWSVPFDVARAVELTGGRILWELRTEPFITPASAQAHLVLQPVMDSGGRPETQRLRVYDLLTGARVREVAYEGDVRVIAAAGTRFYVQAGARTHLFDPRTGASTAMLLSGLTSGGPRIGRRRRGIYTLGTDSLYTYDEATGRIRWQMAVPKGYSDMADSSEVETYACLDHLVGGDELTTLWADRDGPLQVLTFHLPTLERAAGQAFWQEDLREALLSSGLARHFGKRSDPTNRYRRGIIEKGSPQEAVADSLLTIYPEEEFRALLQGPLPPLRSAAFAVLERSSTDPRALRLDRARYLLGSGEPRDHQLALDELAKEPSEIATGLLAELLWDKRAPVRAGALELLRTRDGQAACRTAAATKDGRLTLEAVDCLACAPTANALLLFAALHTVPERAEAILEALWNEPPAALWAPLAEYLASRSEYAPAVLQHALDTYSAETLRGDSRVRQVTLAAAFQERDPRTTERLVRLFTESPAPADLGLLAGLFLGRPDRATRTLIAAAFEVKATEALVEPIVACYQAEQDRAVRGALLEGLGRAGGERARAFLSGIARIEGNPLAPKAQEILARR